jgi:aminoglycoside N3'-acetyltransferase
MTTIVTQQEIQEALQALGLSGATICLHASLRSFGHVVAGAISVRDAFLDEGCTLLVPSFSWSFAVPPPPEQRIPRNGWNYEAFAGPTAGLNRIYTPQTNEIDKEMGAIAKAVTNHPHRVRGQHPLCSFSAVGRYATELITGQQPNDVYAPLMQLIRLNGFVLLLGVGLDKVTLLHLAEKQAGRHLFRRWANNLQGFPFAVEVGGCSDGFTKFETGLQSITRTVRVGQSMWYVLSASELLERATTMIRMNPALTHCGNSNCNRCNDAIARGPLL